MPSCLLPSHKNPPPPCLAACFPPFYACATLVYLCLNRHCRSSLCFSRSLSLSLLHSPKSSLWFHLLQSIYQGRGFVGPSTRSDFGNLRSRGQFQKLKSLINFIPHPLVVFRDCRRGSWCFKSGLQCRRFDQLSVWTPITTLDLGSTACLSFNWEDNGLGKCYGRWHPRGWLVSPAQGFVLLQGAQAFRMENSCYKSPFSPLGL